MHANDVQGVCEHGGRAGEQRANHRGDLAPAAWHTLTTNADPLLPGKDGEPAWHLRGDDKYDASDWDPAYLQQHQPGHAKSGDCAARQELTTIFLENGTKRPTVKHWD